MFYSPFYYSGSKCRFTYTNLCYYIFNIYIFSYSMWCTQRDTLKSVTYFNTI